MIGLLPQLGMLLSEMTRGGTGIPCRGSDCFPGLKSTNGGWWRSESFFLGG